MEQRDGMTQEFIDQESEDPQQGQKRSRTATEKGEFFACKGSKMKEKRQGLL